MGSGAARNVSGTKRAVGLFGAVALSAAVVLFAFGGATGKSAAAACNANAKTVESAVSMFQIEHSGVTPTAALLTGHADGAPIHQVLAEWRREVCDHLEPSGRRSWSRCRRRRPQSPMTRRTPADLPSERTAAGPVIGVNRRGWTDRTRPEKRYRRDLP